MDAQPGTSGRTRRSAQLRQVLAAALALLLVNLALYAIAPWLLPVRILEGPLVQLAGPTGVTLVWFTTRPTECTLRVVAESTERDVPVTAAATRHSARIDGLQPGQTIGYRILEGASRELFRGDLCTNKPADQAIQFVVLGDSGRASREQYGLVRDMELAQPDFVLHTGDLVYPDGARGDYADKFFAPYHDLISRVAFWPSLGNHDVSEPGFGGPYREVFALPSNGPAGLQAGNNYWFDYGPARFVVIDSNAGEATLRDVIAPWIETVFADAESAGIRWRFACFHHPPYTGGAYKPDVRIQKTLVPALEAAEVDVVFNGHDHMYQRTWPLRDGRVVSAASASSPATQSTNGPDGVETSTRGTIYIVSASGGARLYTPAPKDQRPAYIAALDAERHSFTRVTIHGDRLELRQVAQGGKILDSVEVINPLPAIP